LVLSRPSRYLDNMPDDILEKQFEYRWSKIRKEKRKAKSAVLIKPTDQMVGCWSLSRR
jgi:hypothetical protein